MQMGSVSPISTWPNASVRDERVEYRVEEPWVWRQSLGARAPSEHWCSDRLVVIGPMFARPVEVALGEVVERDGFVFADLTAAG